WEKGLGRVLNKCKEMEALGYQYMDAEGWLRLLNFGRYSEATPPTDEEVFVEAVKYFAGLKDDSKIPETIYAAHFGDDPADCIPASNSNAREFYSNKEINDLHTSLEERTKGLKVKEDYRSDLNKLKQISADKYAYARAELLNTLELYKPNKDYA
ncbi:hypothetical protein JXC34_07330, partial [Candidatus Woesearchaeota archaeon]|nr:hypothetical protein [Candidatus Woesearchaeota archaeon]